MNDPRVIQVCLECARESGGRPIAAHMEHMFMGECQECGLERFVNNPRNFIWEKLNRQVSGTGC